MQTLASSENKNLLLFSIIKIFWLRVRFQAKFLACKISDFTRCAHAVMHRLIFNISNTLRKLIITAYGCQKS